MYAGDTCRGPARFLSEKTVDEVPDEEAGEFADEHEDDGPKGAGLVEAEGNGYHIPHNRHPAQEGNPHPVSVYPCLLFPEGFGLDLEPFLNPFPFPDPAYPVCEDASEPVAEGSHNQASGRVAGGGKHGKVQGIGTEREDGRRQEGADEKPEKAEFFKSEHKINVSPTNLLYSLPGNSSNCR